MNNLDNEIKKIIQQEIELTDEYKENVKKTLENCIQNKKYKRKKNKLLNTLKKIGITIVVGATAITAYATSSKNFEFAKTGSKKIDENYQESAVEINKTIENEYLKITLDSMAADESYIIAGFIVEFKEKAINEYGKIDDGWDYEDQKPRRMEDLFCLYNIITINSKYAQSQSWRIEKISENKFLYTDIIGKIGIEDKELNVRIYINCLLPGEYRKGFFINKVIQAKVKYNKSQNKFIPQEKVLDENNKIIINGVANTKFETYAVIQKITENITYEQYNEQYHKPYLTDNFILRDGNNQEIKYEVIPPSYINPELYVKNANGEMKRVKNISELNKNDTIKWVQNFFIILGKNEKLESVKIIPIKTTSYIYGSRLEMYKNGQKEAIWYPLIEGENKYSKKSTMGGTLEIEKITIDDDNITFYYNEEGIIGEEDRIVLRDRSDPHKYDSSRYIIADKSKRWGHETNEEVFSRKRIAEKFDNIENLEFSLLFGFESNIDGEIIELEIPEQNNNIADITDVKIIDGKVVTLNCSYKQELIGYTNEEKHTYKIFYDENDIVLDLDEFIDDSPCYYADYYNEIGANANVNELIEKFKKEYDARNGKCEISYE